MTINSDKAWEILGKTDPYWSVLSCDKYHIENLNSESLDEFFQSGRRHIENVLNIVRCHVDSSFVPKRTLDFGCGVGRIVFPLSSLCESVTGVDISDSMLKIGETLCLQLGISNVKFVKSDDTLSQVCDRFDFIHSYIVFQHIPRNRGEKIVDRLIDILEDDGIGVLHFTYFIQKSSKLSRFIYWGRNNIPFLNGLFNVFYFKKPFKSPMIQIHEYNLTTLFQILHKKGCHNCHVKFSQHETPRTNICGLVIFFQKKALPYW